MFNLLSEKGFDMINLLLPERANKAIKILCIGAHSDDIEIGCGGTILRLLSELVAVEVDWVVLSAKGPRCDEASTSASRILESAASSNVDLLDFRDSFFPYQGIEIKDYFENLKSECSPDIVFTHYRHDLHQDHRLVSELTWNTFRNHLILEYEVFKYDGDLGNPNFYVPLGKDVCERKVSSLMDCFPSQANHRWFTADTFLSILRLRGAECNAPEYYAEGFYCRKICI